MVSPTHEFIRNSKGEPYHLFVGTPAHDNRFHSMFAMSLIRLVGSNKLKITTSKVSSGGIHKARLNLASDFKKSGADGMLMIDSDLSFEPQHVFQLVQRGLPIVCGLYCHKKEQLEWCARGIDGVVVDPKTGLQRVSAAGTGFMFISKDVFAKMDTKIEELESKVGRLRYIEDWNEGTGTEKVDYFIERVITEPGYFDKPTLTSEDWGFCYLARQTGFEIMLDTTFFLRHWDGGRGYPEQPPDQMQSPKSQTRGSANQPPAKVFDMMGNEVPEAVNG